MTGGGGRFGETLAAATFVDVSAVECDLPPAATGPGPVLVGVTLNGLDWSEWGYRFRYYRVAGITPPLAPLGAPTRIAVLVDSGEGLQLRARYCELPASQPLNASAPPFVSQQECRDIFGGYFIQPSFVLGFGKANLNGNLSLQVLRFLTRNS